LWNKPQLKNCKKAYTALLPRLIAISLAMSSLLVPANAQNATDMYNIFSPMIRDAIVTEARNKWSRIPPAEASCIAQALEQHGTSITALIQRGITPKAPELLDVRRTCRTATASQTPPNASLEQAQRLSGQPSFDCTKAQTPVALIICSSDEGVRADWDLNSAQWALYFSLPDENRESFEQDETRWLQGLPAVCKILGGEIGSEQAQCVLNSYAKRAARYRVQLNGDALVESRLSPEQHMQVQQALIERGLLNEAADGEFGENTRTAIKRFQEQSGSAPSGFLNVQQRQLLLGEIPLTGLTKADINERASALSVKEADNECHSSDTEKRLIGCTAIINSKARRSSFSLWDALDGRCWAYNDLGQYESAVADCREAIRLAPKRRPYAFNNLGRALLGLGNNQDAISAFTTAIELKSHLASAYFGRAKAYSQSGKSDLARTDFETVLALDPTNQEAKDALGPVVSGLINPPSPNNSQPRRDTPVLAEARVFLADAKQFIEQQSSVQSIAEIANEAARLQIALNAFDEVTAKQSMQRLQALLSSLEGFKEFELQRQAVRKREEARRLAEAKALGEKNIFFVDTYLKMHLGDAKTASLLNLKERINNALKANGIDDVLKANSSLTSYVEQNSLEVDYKEIVAGFLKPPPSVKVKRANALADRLGLSDLTKPLVEGPLEDIILLYNISSTAPHVWRNVRGDVVFQNDIASMCFAQQALDILMVRFAEHLLRDRGARSLLAAADPCDLSAVTANVDIIAFQRGELLKQREEYLLQLAKLVDGAAFRELEVINSYAGAIAKRQAFSLQIEREVERAAREGYGVITVTDFPVACVVVSGSNDIIIGLKELLNRNRDIIAPRLSSDWQFIETSTDLAFLGLQRQQCGYVAASASELSQIMSALRREPQLKYLFAPAWWESKDVAQAAFDVKDKTNQEEKKKEQIEQAKRDEEALNNERARKRETEKTEIEKRLRAQNGVRARGLMNEIGDFVRDLAEKRRTDADNTLPVYSKWLNSRFDEGWETFNVKSDVLDFGMAIWQSRTLDAILVKTVVQQKNRVLGRYEDMCFVFGLVDDVEFQMHREPFGVPCDNTHVLNSWRLGKDFHSGWNAE
jgi:peptidoglycan hydrolase-like protein with peptidoglycan-binding domain